MGCADKQWCGHLVAQRLVLLLAGRPRWRTTSTDQPWKERFGLRCLRALGQAFAVVGGHISIKKGVRLRSR